MRILMVSPVVGDAFGQERVMRDSTELLRAEGHEVFYLADRQIGELPVVDGLKLIPGLSSLHSLTSPLRVRSLHKAAVQYATQVRPDVVHLIDQFDWRFHKALTAKFPVALTSHLFATTCPSSTRLTQANEIYQFCHFKSGWNCVRHHRRQNCLPHFKSDLRRAQAVGDYLLRRSALNKVRAVIAVSHVMKTTLIEDGWPQEKIRVVYNPVAFAERGPHSAEAPQPLIVCATRLEPYKGVETLLKAVAQITSLPWTLWICGDGSERARLQKLTRELKLEDRVLFFGRTSFVQTRQAFESARLVVQPNVGPEPFGLSAAEASALGVPVVAADLPALNEIVEDGKTGLLFPASNVSALASRIESLISSPELASRLGAAAALAMRQRFSPQAHLKATLAVYREVAGLEVPSESPDQIKRDSPAAQPRVLSQSPS